VEKIEMQKVNFFGAELFLVNSPKFEKFFSKLRAGIWEPQTFAFIEKHVDRDTVYLDIGSWIDVTPAWASFKAKRVIAVEPEPYCCNVIENVVAANGIDNITLLKAALSKSEREYLYMVGGAGSSETTLVPSEGSERVPVEGITIGRLKSEIGDHDCVVKVDIEGFEFAFSTELCKLAHPRLRAIQLALHPATVSKASSFPWPFNRIAAWCAVSRFLNEFQSAFGKPSIHGFSSSFAYCLSGILFSRKCKGTEIYWECALSKGNESLKAVTKASPKDITLKKTR
jgi:FkbM family methyltransferase